MIFIIKYLTYLLKLWLNMDRLLKDWSLLTGRGWLQKKVWGIILPLQNGGWAAKVIIMMKGGTKTVFGGCNPRA